MWSSNSPFSDMQVAAVYGVDFKDYVNQKCAELGRNADL